jgi:hypothetical protein
VQGQMEDLQGNPQRRPQHLASQGMQCIEGCGAALLLGGRLKMWRLGEAEARALVFLRRPAPLSLGSVSRQCPDRRCRARILGHGIGGKRLMSWTTFDSLNFPQLFAIVAVGNVCFWHLADVQPIASRGLVPAKRTCLISVCNVRS